MPLGINKSLCSFLLIALLGGVNAHALEKSVVVRVGGYEFAPFVEKEGNEGMLRELITKLNSSQKKYHFEFVHTSANRRYKDFLQRKFDVIFFEDENWSWRKKNINYARTDILLQGEEVAVALKYDRNQSYFESLENKKVRIILGFHYQLNEMDSDQEKILKKGYEQGKSYNENMNDLLEKKVDITFLNSFYLKRAFEFDRELKEKILISERPDHTFVLRGLVHPSSPITVSELEKLGVKKMVAND